MADKKISALASASAPLVGTEVLPIVQSGATVKVTIDNVTAGRDVSVKKLTTTDNVVISTVDTGIDFSATASGSGVMTSEVLTDYEEGTWTPAFAPATGSFTSIGYVANGTSARYTKIGRVVFFQGALQTSGITVGTASGTVYITGLPFTSANISGYGAGYPAVIVSEVNGYGVNYPSSAVVDINSTRLYMNYRATAAGATSALQVSDLATGGFSNLVRFAGSYTI